jgi:DNA-binding transcriptional MerR regulator
MGQDFTIAELEKETGVPVRTIRDYVHRGLLPEPSSRGRGATYPLTTLHRLKVIRLFREVHGLSRSQIRGLLSGFSDEYIEDIAERREEVRSIPVEPTGLGYSKEMSRDLTSRGDAAREHRDDKGQRKSQESPRQKELFQGSRETPERESDGALALERLLEALGQLVRTRPATSRARAEAWVRVRVSSDVELAVRGITSDEEISQLQQIADCLRRLLIHGSSTPR